MTCVNHVNLMQFINWYTIEKLYDDYVYSVEFTTKIELEDIDEKIMSLSDIFEYVKNKNSLYVKTRGWFNKYTTVNVGHLLFSTHN